MTTTTQGLTELGPVDYSSSTPPEGYRCTKCGKHGCKLWREYQSFLDRQSLSCCDCAGEEARRTSHVKYDVGQIDADGCVPIQYGNGLDGGTCESIGWRVPAIPTEDGETYWGYTSVPIAGVEWWRRLPSRVP